MPTPSTPRADGGFDARVEPGETRRLTIPTASDGPFFVGLRNLATNAAATVEATTSLADAADPVVKPFIGTDGALAAGTSDMVLVQSRIAALIVTVSAEADGDVVVNVLA